MTSEEVVETLMEVAKARITERWLVLSPPLGPYEAHQVVQTALAMVEDIIQAGMVLRSWMAASGKDTTVWDNAIERAVTQCNLTA